MKPQEIDALVERCTLHSSDCALFINPPRGECDCHVAVVGADAGVALLALAQREATARELLQEVRGDDKRLGWIDSLDSYYYGEERDAFCKRLDAFLGEPHE